jgi:3-oxoacyl-[acyl-carrier protein] reductase
MSRLSRSVSDRVVLITGAASGMGRAEAMLFADEGAKVAVTDVSGDVAAQVARAIADNGGTAASWALDVRDGDDVARVVAAVQEQLGPIDVLVNNAGIALPVAFTDDAFDDAWERTIGVNLRAQTLLIRACLPDLRRNGDGRVINIASTEGLGATAYNSPYVAAKHGVIGLTRALAVELGSTGVTFNCVCPGPIHTGMTAAIPDDAKTKFARRRVPLRRYGDPEEVAHAVLSLALPASSFINAAVLVVDGGMTAQNT